jgi:hypothetical protein
VTRPAKKAGGNTAVPDEFAAAHEGLRKLVEPYTKKKGLRVAQDGPEGCLVLAPPSPKHRQYPDGLWFICTRVGKRYVSFHLMPIYMCPELQGQVSPALKKRMQGKACFNFRAPDPTLFAELSALTKAAYARWKKDGLV